MSDVERDFIKSLDKKILNASQEDLKKLQELDVKTQLQELTFYDAYVKSNPAGKGQSQKTKTRIFRKNKHR
jgi:hypothetical protein